MKSLDIRVAFSAIDRFTRTVNAARQSAGGLSDSLRKTQSTLKGLDKSSATFQRMTAAVGKTDRSISRARARFDGLSEAQRKNGTLTEKQQTLMSRLGERLDRLTAKRVTEVARLRESASALRQHGVMLSGSSATISNAIRRTEQYNQSLVREKRQLAAVTQARKRYEGAQQMAGKLRSGGAIALGTATAAGYGAGRFLSPAVGFDEEMSNVQALTRLDKSDSQLAALRSQAKKLGAETAFTTRDAASGQAFLAMAGFTPDAIRAALPGVLNMALAGSMELGETADIGSNILSQFSLDAGEMDRVSDVLTGTFTRTNTTLSSLGETMKVVGPVAAGLGISLEEAAAMTGTLARVGIRGSEAGTAMRRSLSRLASPTTAAQKALKELGVETADASGKMRRPFDILLDLQKRVSRFGEVDQVSFFKDIAGEEGFTSLQSLVNGAGDGYLQSLHEQIAEAHKNQEAFAVANKKKDNLGGHLKELDSAWEAFRISVAETVDGPLRRLTQGLSRVIGTVQSWVEENPRLSQTLLLAGGTALALTAVIGGMSLAAGLLIGPLAKLRLGFALLSGGSGIGGTVSAFRMLSAVGSSSLAKISGWGALLSGLAGRLGVLTRLMVPLRGALLGAFTSPGTAISALSKSIGGLAIRLTGIPALFSIVKGGVAALGGGLSMLLSPIGLVGAAFVAAGVLIWKYWGPIKAFFSGFFTGVIQGLAPVHNAFSRLAPVFGVIGNGVKNVWNWFKKVLTPVEESREALNKCASAGQTFGEVLGTALSVLLWPLQKLMEGVGWLLEKLDLIPDGIERARLEAARFRAIPVMWEWDEKSGRMVKREWQWSSEKPASKGSAPPPNVLGGNSGTERRLGQIADNTKGLLDEEKRKRIGPGDIVFKNLPPAFAVRGEWQESKLVRQSVSARPVIAAGEPLIKQTQAWQPVRRNQSTHTAAAAQGNSFSGDIHIHLHGIQNSNPRELARLVGEAVRAEIEKQQRAARGSFRDND